MNEKHKLAGGNTSTVYKSGKSVIRSQGAWSPTIHKLLLHLETVGFTSCPRFLGINENEQEILTFVEGDCLEHYPCQVDKKMHIEGITALGKMMRAFHDATASFIQQDNDVWMLTYPGRLEKEVICHNDIAPYNTTFRHQIPQGFIDFDTSCPAPRIWDIVFALYRFIPYSKEANIIDNSHKRACLDSFFQAYGMPCPEDIFIIMQQRLTALATFLLQEADKGNESFKKMLDEGHRNLYLADILYIKENCKLWK